MSSMVWGSVFERQSPCHPWSGDLSLRGTALRRREGKEVGLAVGEELSKDVALAGVQVRPEPTGGFRNMNLYHVGPTLRQGREDFCPLYTIVFISHGPLLCGGDRRPWIGGGQFSREASCEWFTFGPRSPAGAVHWQHSQHLSSSKG